jgi:hypothetical protein
MLALNHAQNYKVEKIENCFLPLSKRIFMKKCFFLFLVFAATTSFGQGFRFGMAGSSGLGWYLPQTKYLTANGATLNFAYGITADYEFSDNYALNFGFNIGQNGGKLIFDSLIYQMPKTPTSSYFDTFVGLSYEYKNQWIELPISLKLKTNEIGYFKYFASFGIKPSILASAKARNMLSSNSTTADWFFVNKKENDNLDKYREDNIIPVRASLLIQGGFEYNLGGKTSLFGALFFDKGFTNQMSDPNLKANNSMVGLQVGVFF